MNSSSKIEARAADWIARRDNGNWTEEHEQGLHAWLDEAAAHKVAYLRLNAAWQRADRLRALRASPQVARSVERQPQARTLPRARTVWSSRAAAGFAAIGIAFLLSGDLNRVGSRHLFSTPIGARETVALEDGSKLTLNTLTQLSTRVDGNERAVWLDEGEAFFDIAHDATRPFVIRAGNRRVIVVGTKFSLRRDGDQLTVNVVEGRVQVQVDNAAPTLLTRGETAVGEGKNVLVTRRTERQSIAATSWLEGRLVFDQMTIAEAAAQFNRYNRKKLIVADAGAANIRIGGSFDASNVDGFAHLVQSGFGLVIEDHDDRILISSAAP